MVPEIFAGVWEAFPGDGGGVVLGMWEGVQATDKSDVVFFSPQLILQRGAFYGVSVRIGGSKCLFHGKLDKNPSGEWGSKCLFLWKPIALVVFQLGSESPLHPCCLSVKLQIRIYQCNPMFRMLKGAQDFFNQQQHM